jgi:hypothetical protein
MWLLPNKRQLRLSRRIGITGAIGTGGIEDERTISIPDGEQAEISEIRRSHFRTLAPLSSPAVTLLNALPWAAGTASQLLKELGAKTCKSGVADRPCFFKPIEFFDFICGAKANHAPKLLTRLLSLLHTAFVATKATLFATNPLSGSPPAGDLTRALA